MKCGSQAQDKRHYRRVNRLDYLNGVSRDSTLELPILSFNVVIWKLHNTGAVASNPIRGMAAFVCVVLCVGSGLGMFTVQGPRKGPYSHKKVQRKLMTSIPLLGYYTVQVWAIVLKLGRNIIASILRAFLKTEVGISETLPPPPPTSTPCNNQRTRLNPRLGGPQSRSGWCEDNFWLSRRLKFVT
jgi:hypothetical protein